jgi:hypothetical protein
VPEYIEIKPPSWRTAVTIYLEVLARGASEEGKRAAREDLLRLADIVDAMNAEREPERAFLEPAVITGAKNMKTPSPMLPGGGPSAAIRTPPNATSWTCIRARRPPTSSPGPAPGLFLCPPPAPPGPRPGARRYRVSCRVPAVRRPRRAERAPGGERRRLGPCFSQTIIKYFILGSNIVYLSISSAFSDVSCETFLE